MKYTPGPYSWLISLWRSIRGQVPALLPSILAWALAKHYLDQATSILIGTAVQTLLSSMATDHVGWKHRVKLAESQPEAKQSDVHS